MRIVESKFFTVNTHVFRRLLGILGEIRVVIHGNLSASTEDWLEKAKTSD